MIAASIIIWTAALSLFLTFLVVMKLALPLLFVVAIPWGLTDMHPWFYSFVYNIAFIGPSIIITAALLVLVQSVAPRILATRSAFIDSEKEHNTTVPMIVSFLTASVGLFFFIFFLVQYIKSFYVESDPSYVDYSFDPDSMILFVLGLFLVVLGVVSLIKVLKNDFSYVTYMGAMSGITTSAFVFGLYRWPLF